MTARTRRINPDTLPALIVAVLLTSLLGAVSFTLSYSGLSAVAEWASVPDLLAWTVPVTIDASILVYTIAVFIFRARAERGPLATAWTSLIAFTAVSVTANAAHAWDASALSDWHAWAGAAIAGLAPVSVLLTTHTLAELIVARPDRTPATSGASVSAPLSAVATVTADNRPDNRTDSLARPALSAVADVRQVSAAVSGQRPAVRTDARADVRADVRPSVRTDKAAVRRSVRPAGPADTDKATDKAARLAIVSALLDQNPDADSAAALAALTAAGHEVTDRTARRDLETVRTTTSVAVAPAFEEVTA
ncbi:DUF2637 domain-containing protein [Antribacter gilvus]|uniref:DUF2637 domain-containing protein n=1 Tax=Antribacter gilvus TaxID=2304675 RepID=UPI000F7947BB|nr:DUF2637 domain-containing protein [Antribacter gilvus]